MPKYYVSSCDLKSIVAAPTPKEGVIAAFKRDALKLEGKLSEIVVVSEHGHESYRNEDLVFSTDKVLIWAGLADHFQNAAEDINS